MKKITTVFLVFALLAFTSCRISLVPGYNNDAVTKVEQAATATDNLYDDIIGSTDKSYTTYAVSYALISNQITDILVLDSTRKNSAVILIIANDLAKRFSKYQNEHKDAGSINNAQAGRYKDYMHALFESLLNSEKNLNKKSL